MGAVLCAVGLGGPVFALIEQPRRGMGDPIILLALFGGLAVFAPCPLGVATANAMLPLRLFARRNFSFTNLETLMVYAGLSTLTFFLVLFLQQQSRLHRPEERLRSPPDHDRDVLRSPRFGRLSMRLGPRLFMGPGRSSAPRA